MQWQDAAVPQSVDPQRQQYHRQQRLQQPQDHGDAEEFQRAQHRCCRHQVVPQLTQKKWLSILPQPPLPPPRRRWHHDMI